MKRIIVAVTGATGSQLAITLLKKLREFPDIEIHLICSNWAKVTLQTETGMTYHDLCQFADHVHSNGNLGASIASGSYLTDGMIIVPCSMKTLASIRVGLSDNLISRAADVIIKERRKLILVTRETPLSTIHLENMLFLSQLGATIFPPLPAFYHLPKTMDDSTNDIVLRLLQQLNIFHPAAKEWNGLSVKNKEDD